MIQVLDVQFYNTSSVIELCVHHPPFPLVFSILMSVSIRAFKSLHLFYSAPHAQGTLEFVIFLCLRDYRMPEPSLPRTPTPCCFFFNHYYLKKSLIKIVFIEQAIKKNAKHLGNAKCFTHLSIVLFILNPELYT